MADTICVYCGEPADEGDKRVTRIPFDDRIALAHRICYGFARTARKGGRR